LQSFQNPAMASGMIKWSDANNIVPPTPAPTPSVAPASPQVPLTDTLAQGGLVFGSDGKYRPQTVPGLGRDFDAFVELADIVKDANDWNQTSPGSSFDPYYQCAEQAQKLIDVLGKKQYRYWRLVPTGRYWGGKTCDWLDDRLIAGIWQQTANAVLLKPQNGNPYPPKVLYPWKWNSGPAPVKLFDLNEYIRQYPHPIY